MLTIALRGTGGDAPPWLQVLGRLLSRLAAARQRARAREAFLALDARTMKDIGLTQADVLLAGRTRKFHGRGW